MAPVSAILHHLGIRLRRYLDDWLIQASSREQVLLSLRTVLRLQFPGGCRQLGEVSACSDSNHLLSGSYSEYHHFPGFSRPETDRQAALNWQRISVFRGSACKLLARIARSAVLFNSAHSGRTTEDAVAPVSLQPTLGSTGSRSDSSVVSGGPPGPSLVASPRASRTRNLSGTGFPSARLMVRRLGCRLGAHLGDQVVSGRWSPVESQSSINHRELLAIFYALQHFLPLVRNAAVAVYADSTIALAYLRHQGGTRSVTLNLVAQDLLRWAEANSITLLPQLSWDATMCWWTRFLARIKSWAPNELSNCRSSISSACGGQS